MRYHRDHKQKDEYQTHNFIDFDVFEPIAYRRCKIAIGAVQTERPIQHIIFVCAHFV